MRPGIEAALAHVVGGFGAARPTHTYLFANLRANRMKAMVRDDSTAASSCCPQATPKRQVGHIPGSIETSRRQQSVGVTGWRI
jgi:hypothetical protein